MNSGTAAPVRLHSRLRRFRSLAALQEKVISQTNQIQPHICQDVADLPFEVAQQIYTELLSRLGRLSLSQLAQEHAQTAVLVYLKS